MVRRPSPRTSISRTPVSRSLLRRAIAGALLAVVAVTVVTACSRSSDDSLPRPSEEFCELAWEYDEKGATLGRDDAEAHLEYVRPMVEPAPEDIRDDIETFVDALERLEEGDNSVVDDPDIKSAIRRVNRRSIDGCRLHDQDPPGGL